ncbi:MAG: hypothetical protein OEU92_31890 [Alphaproteobacteria bacterium]|nr:hypothetical protein [Alphaproteobacteria bacterium]
MTDQPSNPRYGIATGTAAELGFQFSLYPCGTQIHVFPPDHSIHLRLAKAGGAAPAIAVEIVDQDGAPVGDASDTPIWLLPFDLAAETAAQQIRRQLIEPYLAQSAFDAQLCQSSHMES